MDNYCLHYTLRVIVHCGLHFLFPAAIGFIFFRQLWIKAWIIMLFTVLIDLDHLLTHPILDPYRCSINYHVLHTYYAIAIYVGLLFFNKTRIAGIGLLLHILTDLQDCLWY